MNKPWMLFIVKDITEKWLRRFDLFSNVSNNANKVFREHGIALNCPGNLWLTVFEFIIKVWNA